MISSVSGLPAIIIDGNRNIDTSINPDNRDEFSGEITRDENLATVKIPGKDKARVEQTLPKNKQAEQGKVNFDDMASKIREILDDENLDVEFTVDKDVNRVIMKLIDNQTNEVIRQVPPDVTLQIAKIVASTLGSGSVTNSRV